MYADLSPGPDVSTVIIILLDVHTFFGFVAFEEMTSHSQHRFLAQAVAERYT